MVIRKWKIGVAEGAVTFVSSMRDLLDSVPLKLSSEGGRTRLGLEDCIAWTSQAQDEAKDRALTE